MYFRVVVAASVVHSASVYGSAENSAWHPRGCTATYPAIAVLQWYKKRIALAVNLSWLSSIGCFGLFLDRAVS